MKPDIQQLKYAKSYLFITLVLNSSYMIFTFIALTSDLDHINFERVPILLLGIFWITSLLVLMVNLWMGSNNDRFFLAILWYVRLSFVNSFCTTLMVFYAVGFIQLVSSLLQKYVFPTLTELANFVLANLIGWILSGIIGNLFYDFLKKLIIKK